MKLSLLILIIGATLTGASGTSNASKAMWQDLIFSTVMELEPGKSYQADVQDRFGEPDRRVSSDDGSEQLWAYGRGRLTLVFDSQTGLLRSLDWSVYSGDHENDLSAAQSRFPGSRFVKEKEEWLNPYSAPFRVFFSDANTGVTITADMETLEVSSIFWEIPSAH